MDKFSKSCLSLSSTILLWFLHISMPLFNSILPTVTLPAAVPNSTVEFIHIPSAQLLNLLVGLTTFLSAYSLLYVCAERNISLLTQFVFLTSGFFVTTGHGMHMVCVVMEEQMKETDKLFPLEYFLHEKLSHNLFIPGMFAVCGLIMNAEMKSVLSRLREKKGKEGNTDKINSSSKLWINILLWIGPIFMGSYFSVFSTLTLFHPDWDSYSYHGVLSPRVFLSLPLLSPPLFSWGVFSILSPPKHRDGGVQLLRKGSHSGNTCYSIENNTLPLN